MPASAAGYQYPALQKLYPPALLALFQESVNAAAPRSVTPYWSDISGAPADHLAPTGVGQPGHPSEVRDLHASRY